MRSNTGFSGVYTHTAQVTLALLLVCVGVFAQAPQPDEADLVHFGDLVDVSVVGTYEFGWRGRLTPEGNLDGLNSFGDPIYGLCHSEAQIAADVAHAYSKYLRDPKIEVHIIDRTDRAVVTLDGAVRTPQRFQLRRKATLRELLVLSGGIRDEASGEIQVLRPPQLNCTRRVEPGSADPTSVPQSQAPEVIRIMISDLLKGVASADPVIQSGDLITVLSSLPIYVIGGVNDPKQIAGRTGMTLSRAIATAGGLARVGDPAQVTIFRHEGPDTRVINADLSQIAAGKATDPVLKPYDIVEVGQKKSGKRKYPPVIVGSPIANSGPLPLRIVD